MPATISRLPSSAERERAAKLAAMQQLALELDFSAAVHDEIAAKRDKPAATSGKWVFIMIGIDQHVFVVRWIREHGKYPLLSFLLWAELLRFVDWETGQINVTREELARLIGTSTKTVSAILSSLVDCGALIRHREPIPGVKGPGRAVYLLNPNVGTHIKGEKERERTQAQHPRLELVASTRP